jgi:hypothetical protein
VITFARCIHYTTIEVYLVGYYNREYSSSTIGMVIRMAGEFATGFEI